MNMNKFQYKSIAIIAGIIGGILILVGFRLEDMSPAPTKISWSQSQLRLALFANDTTVINVSLASTQAINGITVEPVPELKPYLQISSSVINITDEDKPNQVRFVVTVPPTAVPGTTIEGTVHAKQGMRTLAAPLPISIVILAQPQKTEFTAGADGTAQHLQGGGSLALQPGMLSRSAIFDVTPLRKSELPSSVPRFATIYAAVDFHAAPIVPDPTTPVATESYQAAFELPLMISLPPGTKLLVATENRFKSNWQSTGDIATVSTSGTTATFSTKAIGKLLLVNEADLGQENEP